MFCGKCGRALPDGVNFCGYCGSPIQTGKKGCPKCLNAYTCEYVFCGNCGTLLQYLPFESVNNAFLLQMTGTGCYLGEVGMPFSQVRGTLSFSNTEIVFLPNKQTAAFSSLVTGGSFTVRGQSIVFPYEEIMSFTEGKTFGLPLFTLCMKDGQKISFSKVGQQNEKAKRIILTHI